MALSAAVGNVESMRWIAKQLYWLDVVSAVAVDALSRLMAISFDVFVRRSQTVDAPSVDVGLFLVAGIAVGLLWGGVNAAGM